MGIVAWSLGPGPAWGQACARAFEEPVLRAMVKGSSDALSNDDPLGHKKMYSQFVAMVPCLRSQLPKDAWARLLINEAIVRRATQDPYWRAPLSTAMAIYPDLDAVPDYIARDYVPSPPPVPRAEPVPGDAALFVDGVLQEVVPVLSGEHILQLWRDGAWQSLHVIDQQIPDAWLVERPREVVTVAADPEVWAPVGRGTLGVTFGLGVVNQLVEDPGLPPGEIEAWTFLADAQQLAPVVGLASAGVQPIASTGGIFWDASVPLAIPKIYTQASGGGFAVDSTASVVPVIHGGAAAILEDLHFGIGGGVVRVLKLEGDDILGVWLPQPHVSLGLRGERSDFTVGGGATNTAAHGLLRGGWVIGPTDHPISWRMGFDAHAGIGWFFEAPPGERQASVIQIQAAARLDMAWGRAQ